MSMFYTAGMSQRCVSRTRLSIESLEPSLVPATFSWQPPAVSDLLWTTKENWLEQDADPTWRQATLAPGFGVNGPSAEIEFDNRGNRDCIMDADNLEIKSLSVLPTYTSSVKFAASMKVTYRLLLDSNDASLTGWSVATGQPALGSAITVGTDLPDGFGPGDPTFTWRAGYLRLMTVNVTQLDANARRSKALVVANEGRTRVMSSATLNVSGDMTWSGGNVAVIPTTAGPDTVNISLDGTATITSTGTWGRPSDATKFTWNNAGGTTVDANGVDTIAGNYFNSGTTLVKQGTHKITGKAESTGLVDLRGRASVDATFAADNTLYILLGHLWGDGTVMGNVSLSKQGATQFAGGQLKPGVSDENGNGSAALST